MPALTTIILTMDRERLTEMRDQREEPHMPNLRQRATEDWEQLQYSDGRVLWRRESDYSRTIAALQELVTNKLGRLNLVNFDSFFGVKIDVGDIWKLIKDEDKAEQEGEAEREGMLM